LLLHQLLDFAYNRIFFIRGRPCRSAMRDGTDPSCDSKLRSNAFARMNKEWTFLKFARDRFSNIFEIKDYASYSHRQEEEGFYLRSQGEILSTSVYLGEHSRPSFQKTSDRIAHEVNGWWITRESSFK
jgi:hypothetical protein